MGAILSFNLPFNRLLLSCDSVVATQICYQILHRRVFPSYDRLQWSRVPASQLRLMSNNFQHFLIWPAFPSCDSVVATGVYYQILGGTFQLPISCNKAGSVARSYVRLTSSPPKGSLQTPKRVKAGIGPNKGGGAQWLRIGVHEDIFVFDHILHFSCFPLVQLG